MNRAFLIGMAALVLAAALIAAAWPVVPPPPTPRPAPVVEPDRAPKGDRLGLLIERPAPLPPSPVIVPVAVAAVSAPGEAPTQPARQRAPQRPTDVCAAHGMHREYYRGRGGWQHWRCVR